MQHHIKICYIGSTSQGDRVRCTQSVIEERIGKVFVVRTGNDPSKKDVMKGHIHKEILEIRESYGDKYELLKE